MCDALNHIAKLTNSPAGVLMSGRESQLLQQVSEITHSASLRTRGDSSLHLSIAGQKKQIRVAKVEQLLPINPIASLLLKVVRPVQYDGAELMLVLVGGVQATRKHDRLLVV